MTLNTNINLSDREINLLIYASMGDISFYRVAKMLHIHQATAKKLAKQLKGAKPLYELGYKA